MNELLEAFDEYFELVPATTNELRQEVFRLRYEVLCQEFKLSGFETRRYPDGLEVDEYDYRSVHYLLRHRPTSAIAGTVRLILVDNTQVEKSFPVEQFSVHFNQAIVDPALLPRRESAEISRLMLSCQFRRREGENEFPFGTDRETVSMLAGRRRFPHPVLGLMAAVSRISAENGITHWYAIMEPALNRLLRRFALQLKPIGPVVEYYGHRQPHFIKVTELLQNAYQTQRQVWELITKSGVLWPLPQNRHQK